MATGRGHCNRALPSRTLSVSSRCGSQPRSTRSVTASPACRSSTAESRSSTCRTAVPSTDTMRSPSRSSPVRPRCVG
eukprot:scaffold6836_cov57-Phaeocystis_antarctica.AAC.1